MRDPPRHVHIDTQYLYAYVVSRGHDEESERKKQIQELIHNKNPNVKAIISFTAVGETFNEINEKITHPRERRRAINEFIDLLSEKRVDLKPANESTFKIAHKIKKEDPRLDDTDILIVSQAICDKLAYLVLFQDSKIIESEVIKDYCVNRTNKDGYECVLKIKENYSR
ncbi:MAG: hypothetical protein NTV10_03035 [Methanoregula sp.]|nr:hypothetical protein [Methanoregula sp.]